MIDVDEIAKECEQMIGDGLDFIAPKSCCNAKQVAELVVMLREAQKDAERYRWMRDVSRHNQFHTVGSADPSEWDEIVDEYIDEYMKCDGAA